MKVFSFCIYGTERNYYDGLLENIQMINEYFPDFEIYIYKGICDSTWVFEGKNVKIIETNRTGLVNTLYRFLPLYDVEVGFVRDADSRIIERDRWCINHFLSSNKNYHIIRDHFWHKSLIMGGMFGWKKTCDKKIEIPNNDELSYGFEEIYLSKTIYPLIQSECAIYTNNHAFKGEHVELITLPQADKYDFVGNVIWNGKPKFEYSIGNPIQHLNWLLQQDRYELIEYISTTLKEIPYEIRHLVYQFAFIANFQLRNVERCQYWLSQYEFAELDRNTYNNSNKLFHILGKKIVASFDSEREPTSDEVVIVYGNYPDWHHALPCSSKLYRHASLFFQLQHDVVEYNPCWEPIQTIYICNLEERSDRFSDTLISLCSVSAPLHRIHHYKAKKDLPPYMGATKNHLDCIQHFADSGKDKCLILEDDIVFIDERKHVWDSISKLNNIEYNYDLCFLAISKIGKRDEFDDLLSRSKQACTTSSAYFLQKSTASSVLDVVREGFNRMESTGDYHTNCIDRYWSKLTNVLFFKKKLAYQRPSFSNLTKTINFNLD